jgi:hypothetical protein
MALVGNQPIFTLKLKYIHYYKVEILLKLLDIIVKRLARIFF